MTYAGRILVVDDDLGPRESLRMILKSTHQVFTASGGREALEIIYHTPPDLVFLDIKMRDRNGMDVLRDIKNFDPNIEVIMMTAYASIETARLSIAHNASDYLLKPFSKRDVEAAVAKALARRAERLGPQQAVRMLMEQLRATAPTARNQAATQELTHGVAVMLQHGLSLLHATAAIVHLHTPPDQRLLCTYHAGIAEASLQAFAGPAWDVWLQHQLTLQQPLWCTPTMTPALPAEMATAFANQAYAAALCLPLGTTEHPLGMLTFFYHHAESRPADWQNIGQALSAFTVAALRTHQRYQATQQDTTRHIQRLAQLSILREISRAILGSLEREEVLMTVSEHVRSGLDYHGFHVWMRQNEQWQVLHSHGPNPGWQPQTQDAPQTLRVDQAEAFAVVLAPFAIHSQMQGLIKLVRPASQEPTAEIELELIRMLLDYMSIALHNAQLYEEIKTTKGHLERLVQEKEILLKEVYHRVKNNLQLISSLLSLQAEPVTNPQVHQLLRESQNRVKAMALIHDKLYRSASLEHVDVASYVQDLTTYLRQAYGIPLGSVQLTVQITEVFLGLDTAIACGLILHELLSNAFKHAFPAGLQGEVHVTMQRQADAMYTLTVRDTGRGFPRDVDFRHTASLGMQLVTLLTEQLRGTIALQSDYGSTFTIRFPEPGSKNA